MDLETTFKFLKRLTEKSRKLSNDNVDNLRRKTEIARVINNYIDNVIEKEEENEA